MNFFTKILVHITDPAADKWMMGKAVEIARRNNATITIIGATKEVPEHLESLVQEKFNLDLQRILRDRKNEQLQKVIVFFDGKEVEITYRTVRGTDFREIIKVVLRGSYNLLITRKIQENTLKEKFFGTAVANLIRECPCPVWIFPEKAQKSFTRILVSVDTSTTHEKEQKLNQKLLQIASVVAKNENADIHVLHCWKDEGENISGGPFTEVPDQLVKRYNIEAEKKNSKQFYKFLDPFRATISDKHIYLIKDDPGHGISKITQDRKIELLILGTLSRSGLQGYLIGNTAERVLNQVDCSILTIKPDGFMTPVKLSNS